MEHQFATIEVAADGPVGRLTLARPQSLNALSGEMLGEIAAAASWFDARAEVRVVIVSGAGRTFSAGADVTEIRDEQASWQERRSVAQQGGRAAGAVQGMRAVTVAALHGHVVGGGVVLAAVCDLRVAAEGTIFVIPEVDLGIPLAWGGIPRLMTELGPARTKELVMTCRPFSAAEAYAWGFLNSVVPPDDLDAEAVRFATALAAKPAVPLAITKEHVNAIAAAATGAGFAFAEADGLLAALGSPESRAARNSYLEKIFGERSDPSPS